MESSKEIFEKESDEFFCTAWLKRGISDYYQGTDQVNALRDMIRLEAELSQKYSGHTMPSLGYGKSEALYSLAGGNAPNNVFPVFWWPTNKKGLRRETLLRRLV
jgi:hypothetical protein